jgi:adenine-specific DNA-methyltransferase
MYNYKIYTPIEIAREMAATSLALYFKDGFTVEKLNSLRVLDLSCGSGNLLLTVLEKLIRLSYKLTGKYFYNPQWITGYDIDEDALILFNLKFKELLKKYSLQGELSLFCMDALLTEDWEKYDIILGNPPYLGEKNHKEVFQAIRETDFGKKFYEAKMDYFYFFIEKGIELLKADGYLTYLTTNYWLKADSAFKLRNFLSSSGSFIEIKNFDSSLFSNAVGQHNLIFTWKKGMNKSVLIQNENAETFYQEEKKLYGEGNKILLIPEKFSKIDQNIKTRSNFKLGELLNINQGIVSGYDKAFIFDKFQEEFSEYLRPFYKNKDVGKYEVSSSNPFWILYLNKGVPVTENILEFLAPYREKLSNRREVLAGKINWWELQWGRDEEIFKSPKIVVRQRCKSNNFAYCEKDFFGSADIYYLTPKSENINLFYILGYLNSETFFEWFKYNGKIKGKNLEFYSTPLKETPIYYPENPEELNFIADLVKSQIKNYSEEIQQKINHYFKNLFSEK